ncbi:MAG: hypothetical protein NTY63_06890 [Candidatus Bipolaricaulota bacterium]|nr:hypothetical protein [Candidatus Bipolaricaulota bacterium]
MAVSTGGTPIGTWVLAIVAVTSATIAAFQSRIARLLVRPKLGLEVHAEPPDFHHTLVSHPTSPGASADAYYFNLRVRNTGNSRAEQVEIFVADVLAQQPDGTFNRVASFLPKNLLWSWTLKPFLDALSPGMYTFCTLGHIFDPARRRDFPGEALVEADEAHLAGRTAFSVAVQFPSSKPSHILPPGTYRLILWIAAGNARKVEKRLELVLSGDWTTDEARMLSEGVRIRVV